MQDRPICFQCHEAIEHSSVFEAPCGHEDCPSASFHGICLMEWRERRQQIEKIFEMWKTWVQEHTENERREDS